MQSQALYMNSIWDGENWGVRALLPSTFQLSLHGLGFVLPETLGDYISSYEPTKELYIRWIQLNSLLPIIQITHAPWSFDAEVSVSHIYSNSNFK